MRKIIKWLAICFTLFLIIMVSNIYFSPFKATASGTTITDIDMNDDMVILKGGYESSMMFYHDFDYQIKGENLHITIWNHSGLQWHHNESGEIDIKIIEKLSQINNIYLDGADQSVLLWERDH